MSIIATPNFGIIPSAASPGYPNEPNGATILNTWPMDFSNVVETGWPGSESETLTQPWYEVKWTGPGMAYGTTVTDPTAPVNPTKVGREAFADAWLDPPRYGNSPEGLISADVMVAPQSAKEVYISYHFRYAPDFVIMGYQLKHIQLWDPSNGGWTIVTDATVVNEHGHPVHPPYALGIYFTDGVTNPPAVTGAATLVNDQWYQVEVLINYQSQTARVWLDGDLYLDVKSPPTWPPSGYYAEFEWVWTYGGSGDMVHTLNSEYGAGFTTYMYHDELRVSYTT